MAMSPFTWFHRYQKHMLFVLAVVLIVGWLIGPTLGSLFRGKERRDKATDGVILGKSVSHLEFGRFKERWKRMFGLFREPRGATKEESEEIHKQTEQAAWAYLAATRLGEKLGAVVPDQEVIYVKRGLLAQYSRQRFEDTVLGGPIYQTWLKDLGMNGPLVDDTIRELLRANRALDFIKSGLHSTRLEALRSYLDSHRKYDLKYVAIKDEDYLKDVKEPSEEEVTAYYEGHKGAGGLYWRGPSYEVAYAAVSIAKIEARTKVSISEIEQWYEKNRETYRLDIPDNPEEKKAEGTDVKEVKYRPLEEVKPSIEETIRRQRAYDEAKKLMDAVVKAFEDQKDSPSLESVVRQVNDEAVTFEKTTPLTEQELMKLPGIGDATGPDNLYFNALVAGTDREKKTLSPVLSAAGEGLYVFRVMNYVKEGAQPLDVVREKVTADIKRERAEKAAKDYTDALLSRMREEGSGFDKVVEADKLKTETTGLFRNSVVDINRPKFIAGEPLTVESKLLGPLREDSDRVWVIAQVIGTEESSTETFRDELQRWMGDSAGMKGYLMKMEITDSLLKAVGFKAPTKAPEKNERPEEAPPQWDPADVDF